MNEVNIQFIVRDIDCHVLHSETKTFKNNGTRRGQAKTKADINRRMKFLWGTWIFAIEVEAQYL